MPAKNAIKIYNENGFYHIYNRGVEKRDIFLDEPDFKVFLSYLKTYLLPKDINALGKILSSNESSFAEKIKAEKEIPLKNFSSEIDLIAYCLLPNHFHLLIRQKNSDGINRFMQAFTTRYTIYFNKKYYRAGSLFQGVYKAVLIRTEEQLLHISRYIHLNPFSKTGLKVQNFQQISWLFSLPEYLGFRKTEWLKQEIVLNYFNRSNKGINTYAKFMEEYADLELLAPLALDLNEN